MNDQLTEAPPPTLEDVTLVALTPADMAPAQSALAEWCVGKIATLKAEADEIGANLTIAAESGVKWGAFLAASRRAHKRVVYYEKIKAAIENGYLIVPNMPVDLFAVRVRRNKQPESVKDYRWATWEAKAELLPAGEGRYVDEQTKYRDESFTETIDGKEKTIRRYVSDEYDDVDFPVTLVKPSVLQATQRAMALKLFDELGIVQNNAGKDPIVVGRLLDPRGNRRCATFFVAWWLDTATL